RRARGRGAGPGPATARDDPRPAEAAVARSGSRRAFGSSLAGAKPVRDPFQTDLGELGFGVDDEGSRARAGRASAPSERAHRAAGAVPPARRRGAGDGDAGRSDRALRAARRGGRGGVRPRLLRALERGVRARDAVAALPPELADADE